jgi:hypothetical protein
MRKRKMEKLKEDGGDNYVFRRKVEKPKGCTDECTFGTRVPKCTASVEERMQYCGQVSVKELEEEQKRLGKLQNSIESHMLMILIKEDFRESLKQLLNDMDRLDGVCEHTQELELSKMHSVKRVK